MKAYKEVKDMFISYLLTWFSELTIDKNTAKYGCCVSFLTSTLNNQAYYSLIRNIIDRCVVNEKQWNLGQRTLKGTISS